MSGRSESKGSFYQIMEVNKLISKTRINLEATQHLEALLHCRRASEIRLFLEHTAWKDIFQHILQVNAQTENMSECV